MMSEWKGCSDTILDLKKRKQSLPELTKRPEMIENTVISAASARGKENRNFDGPPIGRCWNQPQRKQSHFPALAGLDGKTVMEESVYYV